jgi:lipopolysaccharide transport system permease protein
MVQGAAVSLTWAAFLLPLLLLICAMLGLGLGTLASAVTAKYRDLSFMLSYAMQLWMFASTVIYPLSSVPERYRQIALLNPMTPVIETFRYGFLGTGEVPLGGLVLALGVALLLFLFGLVIFTRIEQTAMDTI